jgi:hypothetical protein
MRWYLVIADVDDVIHAPLYNFCYDQTKELQHKLNTLLSVRMGDAGRHVQRASRMPTDYGIEEILSRLWVRIVKPVLDALAIPVGHLFYMGSGLA